jgi:hypothetical protein
MTREEPSLETWMQNIRMMDKVQKIEGGEMLQI